MNLVQRLTQITSADIMRMRMRGASSLISYTFEVAIRLDKSMN